jgi:hypothetical protein
MLRIARQQVYLCAFALQWEAELGRLSVFVMESQSLVNLLTHKTRVAHPSQIDMLVRAGSRPGLMRTEWQCAGQLGPA